MEIQEIKSRLTLAEVIRHYGFKADKYNRINCPFHDDKTPSMQLYWKTHTAYCFSANCTTHGKSLDVIDFIMNMEKSTKHEAIKKAESMITGTATPQELTRTAVLTKMFTYFKNGVHNSKPAQEYIKTRNLDHTKLEIGYNSGQFHHGERRDEALIQSCVKVGLLSPYRTNSKTGGPAYKPFAKECISFALRNKTNHITGLYFRSTTNNSDQKHFYLKDRQGLYPSYPKASTKKLILAESIIDTATLLQIEEVNKEYSLLALYGTNALTEEHTAAIRELKELEEIIFFLNGDEAGKKATAKYAEALHILKPEIKITEVSIPENEDINSLAQSHEAEIFLHLISKRELLFSPEKPVDKKTKAIEATLPTVNSQLSTLNTGNPEQLIYETAELKITVWGGIEKENLSRLKVSLHVQLKNDKYKNFRDDCNLYSHTSTQKLIRTITETLELSTATVSNALTDLAEQLEKYRLLHREERAKKLKTEIPKMGKEEEKQAEKFLRSENLIKNTLTLISQSGLVGEQQNGLLLFFLYLSRLSDEPLHAIIFGKSGSGKTYLQTKVSECLPEEAVRTITSLTENTLYYSPKDFWKHKVLLIEDLDGVYNAFLPLREMMSKQSITKLTTDKDAKGNNVQKVLTVEGPICVSGATTKENVYEDNANRSFLLHINESAGHMEEVMDYQRKAQAGLIDTREQERARTLLKNTQRLLKKIKVINPYAPELKIPDSVFKKLRTNIHYLKLIETISLYHQQQREIKKDQSGEDYIETKIQDISWANRLVKESLLRKSDELSGEQREFFESLKRDLMRNPISKGKEEEQIFYAKDIRKKYRMHPMKLARHLQSLESRGYIKRKGGTRYTGFEYQVITWEEYRQLQQGIEILDNILEKLKEKEAKKKVTATA